MNWFSWYSVWRHPFSTAVLAPRQTVPTRLSFPDAQAVLKGLVSLASSCSWQWPAVSSCVCSLPHGAHHRLPPHHLAECHWGKHFVAPGNSIHFLASHDGSEFQEVSSAGPQRRHLVPLQILLAWWWAAGHLLSPTCYHGTENRLQTPPFEPQLGTGIALPWISKMAHAHHLHFLDASHGGYPAQPLINMFHLQESTWHLEIWDHFFNISKAVQWRCGRGRDWELPASFC